MEEKKFDAKKLIGYILIAGLMTWMFYMNKPTEAEIAAEKVKAEQVEAAKKDKEPKEDTAVVEAVEPVNDSLANIELQNKLGKFAYSASLPSAVDASTTISNKVIELSFNNKGGYLNEAKLKDYKTHDGKPVYLVKDNNASLNIVLSTTDNRILNTKDLYFTPTVTKNGNNQVVSMKLQASPTQFLEYRYEIKENDYLIDFTIRSQGLASVVNTSNPVNLDWKLKAFPNEKALSYENQNTAIHYLEDGDMECLGMQENDDVVEEATWVSFKQHFFSSILIAESGFKKLDLKQENYVERDTKETEFLKGFEVQTPLAIAGGEINNNFAWYYGPNDYQILKSYEGLDLEENINLGWGVFGFLNKYLFIPVFKLLSGFIGSYGLIIILMTIVVRLIMSPLVYKSYMSSAKMKVIRPELQKVNEKYPDKKDAMKRQQETMRIQRESGVSMMSGCIPALLQMPIFFALFKFFPKEIGLRQKNFLWAEDLSAYDSVYKLPFDIPFYGDHVSLFPILASIAIFFYMRMSQAQQANMQAPVQEGMPDMQKMMKYMLYFSPLMMLVFFNNYASGLSLYYFVSNLLTIGIMLAIKKFLIDEEKVLAKIKAHKKKPKKQNKFQKKMQEMMEQAEQQQKASKKK
ncbi:membrane protein insertase YidC [Pseudofulvibacter geojedonensis]|uniref:Membrane protein insertase YidC n=1 Tax=Pseudofulvibacter geojedonensis TaxID=1123758 RepID=A0ABW3I586_9FLAO